jgi:hypothetical protein
MKSPRRYAPMGGSLAPVRVAGFRWNGWQPSAVYAVSYAQSGHTCDIGSSHCPYLFSGDG